MRGFESPAFSTLRPEKPYSDFVRLECVDDTTEKNGTDHEFHMSGHFLVFSELLSFAFFAPKRVPRGIPTRGYRRCHNRADAHNSDVLRTEGICAQGGDRVFCGSVEIARVGEEVSDQRGMIREVFRDQMGDSAFPFENSIHAQQSRAQ